MTGGVDRSRRQRQRITWSAAVLVAALPLLGGRAASAAQATPADWRCRVAPAIEALLAAPHAPGGPLAASERLELASLYAPGRHCALWSNDSGSLSADADEALALLGTAAADGLDEDDYGLAALRQHAAAIGRTSPPDAGRLAGVDVRLSAAMLRYLHHLHLGRTDPRAVGVRMAVTHDRPDFAGVLRAALASHALRTAAATLAPSLPQYAALRRQLARYRALGDTPAPPLPPMTTAVHPGERYAGAGLLRGRLVAFEDLPAGTATGLDDTYDPALAEGVQRFQMRHGLTPDGVLGRATFAALSVPIGRRIRQIELALERLRWLPDIGGERVIVLNIPMFRLGAWDASPRSAPGLVMRAIVGRALVTQTPVIAAEVRAVVFRPYWNVPRSILLGETLPALRDDPAVLSRSGLEIVDGPGDDARVVPATPENLARLREGTLRLRQRPGPENALGLVKLDMPNDAGVYLHGTPAVQLFERSRRDFSHGCIRVEDPAALAAWVLREEPGWDRTRVEAAMTASVSSRVPLRGRIRVVLFYTTAAIGGPDGALHFAEDIYRLDARLDARLKARRPTS